MASTSGPAYRRVADELRKTLLSDAGSTAQLPTEAELCALHGVSRHTVRRAYQELVAEKLVDRVPGRGTFPAEPGRYVRSFGSVDDLMGLAEDTEMEVVRPLRLRAGSPRARADLEAGQVMEVWIRRLYADEPFAITIISFPVPIGAQLQDTFLGRADARGRTTALQLFETTLGRRIRDAVQEVTIDRVTRDLARLIDLAAGDTVLRIDRLYRDEDGVPVESTVSYFNPARYTYRVELERG
jgi:GntR family transcriptional regulator